MCIAQVLVTNILSMISSPPDRLPPPLPPRPASFPPSLPQRLAQLVCVEGIVTKCSLVRPKVVRSVHYCPAKQEHLVRDYRDATSISIGLEAGGRPMLPTNNTYPNKDKDGHPLETEFGLSTYKDHQSVTIQEMPERAPLGEMPRSISLVLEHDLVVRQEGGKEGGRVVSPRF